MKILTSKVFKYLVFFLIISLLLSINSSNVFNKKTINAKSYFQGLNDYIHEEIYQINNGLEDLSVNTIAIDPKDSRIIYAGTGGGVYKSTNRGDKWFPTDNKLLNEPYYRSVYRLFIDPVNTQTLYAIVHNPAGVFKTTNGGASWFSIDEGLKDKSGNFYPQDIAIDPKNPQIIYCGDWSNHLSKSTNGGISWFQPNKNPKYNPNCIANIAIDPTNTNIIYLGTCTGLAKSIDGGENFGGINKGLKYYNALFAIDPKNTKIIYCATYYGTGGGPVYKSIDGGEYWTPILEEKTSAGYYEKFVALTIDPTNIQIIYAVSSSSKGVFKSTNGGSTWAKILPPPKDEIWWLSFAMDSVNNIFYFGTYGKGIYRTGIAPPSQNPDKPPRGLKAYPGDNKVFLEWDPPEDTKNLLGYYIYRAKSSGGYTSPAHDFFVTGTTYLDENVENGTTYYYICKVVYNDKTESPPSNEVMVTPKPLSPIINITDNQKVNTSSFTFTGKVDPGSKVFVNGKEVVVDSNGNFTATVTLNKGTNTIKIEVRNKSGDSMTITKTVVYEESTKPPSGQITIILQINNPYMTVNGVKKEIDPGRGTVPVIVKGRTLVPIRAIIEELGGTISWDGVERKVTIKLKTTTIELWIDKKIARVNGINKELDVPPQIINGRTMLPLRFVTEELGCEVLWEGTTKTITITYIP